MASNTDFQDRLAASIGRDKRLHVESIYHGQSLPKWLTSPIDASAANAPAGTVSLVTVNPKGHLSEAALVVISLADFERILQDSFSVTDS